MPDDQITLDDKGFKEFFQKFKASTKKRDEDIARALSDSAELIVRRTKTYYLIGKGGGLKVQSGMLRASVTKKPGAGASKKGKHYIVRVGTKYWYGKYWEGVDRSESIAVKAHTRKIKKAFGKPIQEKSIDVKGHTRKARFRKWLQPSFDDTKTETEKLLERAGVLSYKTISS